MGGGYALVRESAHHNINQTCLQSRERSKDIRKSYLDAMDVIC